MATDHQDHSMNEQEPVEEGGQPKARVGHHQQGKGKQNRASLEQPGESIVRIKSREREEDNARNKEDDRFPVLQFHRHIPIGTSFRIIN